MNRLVYICISLGVLGLSLLSQSCSTNRTLSPYSKTFYQYTLDSTEVTVPQSDFILSFEIAKHSIIDSFGVMLDNIMADPWTYEEQNLTIQLTRMDNGQLSTQNKKVLISLPLNIQVSKPSFVGDMKAYGKVNVSFMSELSIDANWNLTTKTTIVDYTWIERPTFNLGVITLPIQWISDEVIRRIKDQLTTAIDESILANFDLPIQMSDITQTLLTPYQLDSTVGGWVSMTADSAHLAPVRDDEHYTISRLYTPVRMSVLSRQPINDPIQSEILPPFSWKEDIGDSTHFNLWVDLHYDYLTKIARQNFINHTFKNGNQEVKIEDLTIYGDKSRLYVKCQTSGSFNGEIIIAGIPVYKDGMLKAEDIEWDIHTKNLFHKAASWLGKGYIHDQLNTMLVFDIEDYLTRAKAEISTKLDELKKNRQVTIEIEWGQFNLNQLHTGQEALQALMSVKMKIHIIIDDLKKLSFD